ncbi:LLM class flavin-dependent oxidoreductase [Herbiconiux ginsengi]|uniref:Flavin-dependent oxidoreductase, luciferase family (Includes alkanesulfonate monooxygenase SsuD and methylene tetrahydromethanopterin reductase) n=1 Tax=Herbiconiux ginsengi TaxID=381665 RepID=A0A1H3RY17_9MICO|nr:LLM class flavin-dependent oxidoreductase [Herbiconiux ginsengi]SDZ30582.1 Flavin-dependent oxidoreductase, luciferase family (includes alkanesulfonate monooxygenase SsuD and methylene tetrahydromethanopterin reductase) [Herbiconiux ginsengi]
MTRALHLAVALDGTGWHPAAWREASARPTEIFTARYWLDLVLAAERGGVDFVTIEDSLSLQSSVFAAPDDRTDQVRGRLDALLIASSVAPLTTRIGLVPTVTTTHTEPFHVATALQTLDFASEGRAGWRVQVSASSAEARHFGRRTIEPLDLEAYRRGEGEALMRELFDEAGEVIEVVRRLWDSWEDDAIVRDVENGRFLDGSKVHYTDFAGRFVSVTGASITPRSPQGQPPVTALAHATIPYELAAEHADLVYVTPHSPDDLERILAEVHDAEARLRDPVRPPLLVYADLVVLLEEQADAAENALRLLDDLAGAPLTSDALVVAGTPAALVERLLDGHRRGLDGFRLRPARLPADLDAIAGSVIPALEAAGVRAAAASDQSGASASGSAATLRDRLGLERPANLFTASTRPTEVRA